MSKKPTMRRTNSADTFLNSEEYDKERNRLKLPGHQPHELSVLGAENPSYLVPLNDVKEEKPQLYAPKASRPLPDLTNLLNLPRPGEYTQSNEKYDREGLPPPPSLKKSSSRKSKKEPSLFEPPTILERQPFSSQTQTFSSLNPGARKTTKLPKKKSKGGKNRTKKRKAKKTKKNKKNKK